MNLPSQSPVASANSSFTHSLQSFDYSPLNRLIFGPGCLDRLGDVLTSLKIRKVLLVTDPGLEAVGHPQRARKIVEDAGLECLVFDQVEENPTTKHVNQGLQVAKKWRPDGILAVGGGSAMDCAKGINFLYSNGGIMQDYKGFGRASQPMLPSVGVPTTAGTGSESQSYALIADEKTHLKMACGDRKAAFQVCLLDPELTVSLPASITAISGLDAITHAIESYVCLRRNPVSQIFSLESWRLLDQSFEHVLRSPDNVDFRGQMQLGATWAGLAIENSMLGAAHACANPLTAHYGLVHGLAVAILLPHVIRFNSQKVGHLYSELVQGHRNSGMDPVQASEFLAKRITVFLEMAGLPLTLHDCGVSKEIFFILAEEASQQWTGKFNPVPVSEEDLLALYRSAF